MSILDGIVSGLKSLLVDPEPAPSPTSSPTPSKRLPPREHPVTGAREKLVLLIDCSLSMEEEDYPPSRIAAARKAGEKLVRAKAREDLEDMVGVVAFANAAEIVADMTPLSDAKAILREITRIEIDGSTNLGAGLKKAGSMLRPVERDTTHRIIILTDGEYNAGPDPIPIARSLKKQGMIIEAVGIGGSPEDVNEAGLLQIVSTWEGIPLYLFIRDSATLVTHFEKRASKLVK